MKWWRSVIVFVHVHVLVAPSPSPPQAMFRQMAVPLAEATIRKGANLTPAEANAVMGGMRRR